MQPTGIVFRLLLVKFAYANNFWFKNHFMRKFYSIALVFSIVFLANTAFSHDGIKKGFHFTENKGQIDSKVVYHSKLHVGNMFLEKDRFTFDLFAATQMDSILSIKHQNKELNNSSPEDEINFNRSANLLQQSYKKHSYSMIFQGANS